jgi:hypothetical protein
VSFFNEDGAFVSGIFFPVKLAFGVHGQVEAGFEADYFDLAEAHGAQLEDGVGVKGLANSCKRVRLG